ncbi:be34ec7d-0e68-46fe-bb6a-05f4e13c29ca [Thermothielavioides terrestris]|nr:be34ec7d-0e68-46fe-bb6a-05f4e13c29ca [Thermothielavioides terrestris]
MFPAIHTWRRGEPARQEYFTFKDGLWHPVEVQGSTIPPGSETPASFQFSVLSWNIDFMRPHGDARMTGALQHLHSLTSRHAQPSVIMLNEMTEGDLKLIKSADWVREHYNITDASPGHWESPGYGTTMLVPRALPIKDVFRMHYERTAMQRDALCVDVPLPRGRTLRLCTTHLESLKARPPLRPAQLAAAARLLREAHAGVLGGDLNAIEPFDRTLHAENGLRDAYLDSGGVEGAEEGMTWGQMAGRRERDRFGLSRMDKILFCGGVRLLGFERFGMDVLMEGTEEERQELMDQWAMEKPWVTDHLGVKAEFHIELADKDEPAEEDGVGQEPGQPEAGS